MKPVLRSNLLLLLAAVIWGFAFVAQRVGMNFIGPFTFNGLRFTLGTLVLLPFLLRKNEQKQTVQRKTLSSSQIRVGAVVTGLLLFAGSSLQQVGIQYTTAGKAGFLTDLYVVFVPVIGIFLKHKIGFFVWAGVILSSAGLYLLSITNGFTMERGDLLVLLCAIVFSAHVLIIGWLSPEMDSFRLALTQFSICAGLSLMAAFLLEHPQVSQIVQAMIPVLYGGLFSVGIAFTLQVVAQKNAHPASAAIILSLEAVFAALGGWLILDEHLSFRAITGCVLMLAGMITVQFKTGTRVP